VVGKPKGRRVAVWRDTFAPYSETFIWDELRHHVRYAATVFAWERLNADRFPWDDVVTFDGDSMLGRIEQAVYRSTSLSPRFVAAVRRGGYSLVHAHFGTAGVRALPYIEMAGLPSITMFHGGDLSRLAGPAAREPANWLLAALAPRLFRRSELILAASEDLQHNLVAAGCPAEKVRLFRLGIDLTQFAPRRDPGLTKDVHVIMIGRLVPKKGFDDALRALGQHLDRAFRVTLVGEGPLRSYLEAVATQSGLSSRVRFAGAVSHGEVRSLLTTADLIVTPSVVTPSGDRDSGLIVLKEAAATGLPAVGTIHGGLPEIIEDGETGYLVPEHDIDALADRIGRLLGDAERRRRMGIAARAKMEREYDIRHRVAALEDLYDEVVETHRSQSR
jgi:colanic acid/amylovoran biosynthesis glycosyltransferase